MARTARGVAADILLRIERDRAFAPILLDRELARGDLHAQDRALATELVYGVCRRRGTLDYLTAQFSGRNAEKLERGVQVCLRLGLYQLFFLERVPASAAVNETVNLAKRLAPKAAGLVNAVLRRADRERDQVEWPDAERDPASFLSTFHSHPMWLVDGWIRQLGVSEAGELAKVMAEHAPLTLRVNGSRDEFLERLAAAGVQATSTRFSPSGVILQGAGAVAGLPGYAEGAFAVQDESSQVAVLLLDPQPGERVLDACSAPGGKAAFAAQLMEGRGEVLAGDINPSKLRLIRETAARLKAGIVTAVELDAAAPPAGFAAAFDRVLVDAPCSGLGVLRRKPEGKWWKKPSDPAEHAALQIRILEAAAGCLRPEGVLLYSTCSTDPREDEGVVDVFLSRHPEFVLENLTDLYPAWQELFTGRGMFRSWPHRHGMDGFFAARMRKTV